MKGIRNDPAAFAARPISEARPGYFAVRRLRGGPQLPGIIYRPCSCSINGDDSGESIHTHKDDCDRFYPYLVAEVDGEAVDPDWLWLHGEELHEWQYRWLVDKVAYDRNNPPEPKEKPEPAPRLDPRTSKPVF